MTDKEALQVTKDLNLTKQMSWDLVNGFFKGAMDIESMQPVEICFDDFE